MQFHKMENENENETDLIKDKEKNRMISIIQSDEINNVCFECGTENPEYISINNGIFICKECVQDHYQFPHEISQIVINDLNGINNNELKKLFLGGNKKLIQFINFDFPRLKQFPPSLLYKTRAVDYYRKRLHFFAYGGIRPIKPIFEYAYQLVNLPKTYNNGFGHYRKDLYLSPKMNATSERISQTNLTPISEGNQLDDENNYSSDSEKKDKDNNDNKDINTNKNENKPNTKILKDLHIELKNNCIYSPKKPLNINNNNISNKDKDKYNNNDSQFNNSNFIKSPISTPYKSPYKRQVMSVNSVRREKNSPRSINNNDDYSNINIDKNISSIMTLNNTEKSINEGNDDTTIKAIDNFIDNTKEYDLLVNKNSPRITNNKKKIEKARPNNEEIDIIKIEKNNKIESDKNNKIIDISDIGLNNNDNINTSDSIRIINSSNINNLKKDQIADIVIEPIISIGEDKTNNFNDNDIKDNNIKINNLKKFNKNNVNSKINDNIIKDRKINDSKINDSKINDRKIIDVKLSDRKSNDRKINDSKINDSKNNDRKIIVERKNDRKLNERKINDSKINDSKINDRKIIEGKLTDRKLNDRKINDRKINDIKSYDNTINESKMNDRKINDIKSYDNKINDSKMNDSKTNDSRINDSKMNDKSKTKIEDSFTKNIKEEKLIYPKDLEKFSEKGEKKKKRKYLKAKVSTRQTLDFDELEDEEDYYYPTQRSKPLRKEDFYPLEEKNENSHKKEKKNENMKRKDNFYSEFSSNFINPLKYLKKSFQKKQEEKFEYYSDENSSNSRSYEEEIKTKDNNKRSIKKEIDNYNNYKKDENETKDIKKENKRMQRTNSLENTKESTQSQQDDKNISIRLKYKNRRSK